MGFLHDVAFNNFTRQLIRGLAGLASHLGELRFLLDAELYFHIVRLGGRGLGVNPNCLASQLNQFNDRLRNPPCKLWLKDRVIKPHNSVEIVCVMECQLKNAKFVFGERRAPFIQRKYASTIALHIEFPLKMSLHETKKIRNAVLAIILHKVA
jgi:hypothetical protein